MRFPFATAPLHPSARLIPTRRAAVALLTLDAVLLAAPLLFRWQNWFAFAYVPLLLMVTLGALMSGRARPVAVLSAATIPVLLATLGLALTFSSAGRDLLGPVLRGGMIALSLVGAVVVIVALSGWVRFFTGRHAS